MKEFESNSLKGWTIGEGKQTFLWLHGYTMDAQVWETLWSKLPNHRHIGIDLPRHGLSSHIPITSLPKLANDLNQIAKEEGVDYLGALSFGGMIALEMLIQEPSRYLGAFLNSPAIAGFKPDPLAERKNLELIRLFYANAPKNEIVTAWLSSPPDIFTGLSKHPDKLNKVRKIVENHHWIEMNGYEMASLQIHPQNLRDLAKIETPIDVFIGSEDMKTFKRAGHLIQKYARFGSKVYIDRSGHLAFLEQPGISANKIHHILNLRSHNIVSINR